MQRMFWAIDFNSEEALYLQICNCVIQGIAMEQIQNGDSLPSVRQLADSIGINMHTVNKAYSVLRQEGYVKIDRRRGAIVSMDVDKLRALEDVRRELRAVVARARCKSVTREELLGLVEEVYEEYCCGSPEE